MLDTSALSYDLEGTHLGLVAAGSGAAAAIVRVADALGAELIKVERGEAIWAWFGGEAIDFDELGERLESRRPARVPIALGGPASGLSGWRLTSRQAQAAFEIARRRRALVRYAEVALITAALDDDLLASSLQRLYLTPLERERDGGAALRETLRAYFAAGRNISATADALEANRNTISNRLRNVESKTGLSLVANSAEFEVALQLDELGDAAALALA